MRLPDTVREFLSARLSPSDMSYVDTMLEFETMRRRRPPSAAALARRIARQLEREAKNGKKAKAQRL